MITESLIQSSDPLVRKKFRLFKNLELKAEGPTFLQRMIKDKEIRDTINLALENQLDIDSVI